MRRTWSLLVVIVLLATITACKDSTVSKDSTAETDSTASKDRKAGKDNIATEDAEWEGAFYQYIDADHVLVITLEKTASDSTFNGMRSNVNTAGGGFASGGASMTVDVISKDTAKDSRYHYVLRGDTLTVTYVNQSDAFKQYGTEFVGTYTRGASMDETFKRGEYAEYVPGWSEFDFPEFVTYSEDYEIMGDPGDNPAPWEAAQILVNTTLIQMYGTDFPVSVTLVDLNDVDGKECYIYSVSTQSFEHAKFAVDYQGGIYEMEASDAEETEWVSEASPWLGVYMGDGFSITITDFSDNTFWAEISSLRDGHPVLAGTATLYLDNDLMAELGDVSLSLYEDFSAVDFFASESSQWAHLRGRYERLEN